jgi:hypothetical protein
MNKRKAVVYKDNTLGLLYGGKDGVFSIEVLHGLVHKGGKHFTDGPFIAYSEEFRLATLKDFKNFNVRYHHDYIIGL